VSVKPTTIPRWANSGGAITVPSSGKQDVGWLTGERPPAQYKNWLANQAWKWHKFVDALFTDGGNSDGIAAGNADQQNTAEANVVPLFKWRDYLGKIRSLVDHNGYRMGQVSEIDEHWGLSAQSINLPLSAGLIVTGTPAFTNGRWNFTANSQSVIFSLSGHVPNGAIITNVVVRHNRTTTSDSQQFILELGAQTGGSATTPSPQVTTNVTTGTGDTTTDLLSGGKSLVVGIPTIVGGLDGNLQIRYQQTAVTTSCTIDDIEVTYVVPPAGWSASYKAANTSSAATGDAIAYVDPDANVNHRTVKLTGKVVDSVQGAMELFGPWEAFMNADLAYAAEFMIRTGTISDGSNARQFALGIQNNNAGGLNRFVYLFNQNTTANWQLRVVGSSTTDTDTGVAIAANTTYRVRIEILGANVSSAGANTFRIRCFINGTLVANVTDATLPTADMIRPYLKAGTSGTAGGPYDVRVGRMRRAFNHLLTADNL